MSTQPFNSDGGFSTTANVATGNVTLSSGVILGDYPGQGYVGNTAALSGAQVYLASTNGNSFVGVENGVPQIGVAIGNWTFGTDGTFTTPGETGNITGANVISANTISADTFTSTGNVQITAGSDTWAFNNDGSVEPPTQASNQRTGSGLVLKIGDTNSQAIITGPAPVANSYNAAPRLVVAGQDGVLNGEGGDIYLWAGQSGPDGGSGGDIKVDGGIGLNSSEGGTVKVRGGNSTGGTGGFVEIDGGYGNIGGPISITAGGGSAGAGGEITLLGGSASAGFTGGNITITGGTSADGLASYGNVKLAAGASLWTVNNTGNLVLPQGGIVYETNIPFGGLSGKTIALTPYGGTSTDQQLLVYPTAGTDANHLHLTSGNLYNTELFLGNDDLYVKLANTGNIVINSNNGSGNTAQWNFGTDGNLTTPGGSGDITGANLISANSISITDTVFANSAIIYGNVANISYINATYGITGQTLSVVGNVTAGNILSPGLLSVNGNIIGLQNAYIGNGAAYQSEALLGNAIFVAADVGEAYVQAAMVNTNGNGSADWVAYANNGNTDQGWVDIGFTGNTFNDPDYSVTAPNDGYVFAQGGNRYGENLGGNLVLATGGIGNTHDIIFATGGFQTANIKARLRNSDGAFSVTGNIYTPRMQNGGTGMYMDSGYPGYINFFNGTGTTVTVGDDGNISATGNVTGANVLTGGLISATGNTNTLSLITRNGDPNPYNTRAQITMGYNGTTDYPQFVHTIHNAGTAVNNKIEFWTSDGAQTGTFPANAILGGTITQGAMQLAVYASAAARDSVITSPAPGMMIYVTGTGMQVRGATSWNTIAGSGA